MTMSADWEGDRFHRLEIDLLAQPHEPRVLEGQRSGHGILHGDAHRFEQGNLVGPIRRPGLRPSTISPSSAWMWLSSNSPARMGRIRSPASANAAARESTTTSRAQNGLSRDLLHFGRVGADGADVRPAFRSRRRKPACWMWWPCRSTSASASASRGLDATRISLGWAPARPSHPQRRRRCRGSESYT